MKKIIVFLLLSMVIVLSAEAHKYRARNSNQTISIQTFYNQLSPYGDWIYSGDYGYVWRPYFESPEDFRPYSSAGNWVYTTYGWTWVSDYDWGWATFHYGRWDFDNYLGWLWIPGYEWAPAWVSWGSYNNYWGWAPLGPNMYADYSSNWEAPNMWWTFVPRNQFCSSGWNSYIYDRPVQITNITHITNVYVDNHNYHNNNSWYHGPRVSDVEKYNRKRVKTIEVVDNQRPGNSGVRNNRLEVYRPTVENKRNEDRPNNYRTIENVRPATRIQQTNARSNNPGENRNSRQNLESGKPTQIYNGTMERIGRKNDSDTRTSTQVSGNRPTVTREVPESSLSKPDQSRNGMQVAPLSTINRNSVETKRENPTKGKNLEGTNNPRTNTMRTENRKNIDQRGNVATDQNTNRTAQVERNDRQAPKMQSVDRERTQNTIPPTTVSRNTRETAAQPNRVETKANVTKPSNANNERTATGDQKRR
jgi:hypothetical protein